MQRRDLIMGGVAVAGLGAWALTSNMGGQGEGGLADMPLPGAASAQTTSGDIDTSSIPDMVMGNAESGLEFVEYASFTCPHCQSFHMGAFKDLKRDFIDTGKVKFVYREVYFDRPGLWASMLARCGGPEKYFGIVDMLYQGQSTWARAGEPTAIVAELRKIGRLAGLTEETLDTCFQDATMAQTLVAWYQENADRDGITSTPSFMIDGQRHGNMAYPNMKGIIEDALA